MMLLYGVPPTKVAQYTSISRIAANHIHKNLRDCNTIAIPIEHYGKRQGTRQKS